MEKNIPSNQIDWNANKVAIFQVKYVDRNSPMTSSPRVIDFQDSTFEEEESQQNTSR